MAIFFMEGREFIKKCNKMFYLRVMTMSQSYFPYLLGWVWVQSPDQSMRNLPLGEIFPPSQLYARIGDGFKLRLPSLYSEVNNTKLFSGIL